MKKLLIAGAAILVLAGLAVTFLVYQAQEGGQFLSFKNQKKEADCPETIFITASHKTTSLTDIKNKIESLGVGAVAVREINENELAALVSVDNQSWSAESASWQIQPALAEFKDVELVYMEGGGPSFNEARECSTIDDKLAGKAWQENRQDELLVESFKLQKERLAGSDKPNPDNGRHVLGDPDAPVTIVGFESFQNTASKYFFDETFPQIKQDYIETGKARYIYRHGSADTNPKIQGIRRSLECGGEQGKFWETREALYENQFGLIVDQLIELGIEPEAFKTCAGAYRPHTKKQYYRPHTKKQYYRPHTKKQY